MKKDLKRILDFRDRRDWKKFHFPKNLAISLVLEATEVLELFQWTKDNELPKDRKVEIEEELADVYYYLLLLACDLKVDLRKSFDRKMEKNEKHYPVDKSRGKSTKYNKL